MTGRPAGAQNSTPPSASCGHRTRSPSSTMKTITFRTALLTDPPAIVALLVGDESGTHRETTSSTRDERDVAAFTRPVARPRGQK